MIGHLGAEIEFLSFWVCGRQGFGHPREFWHVGPVQPAGTVQERRRPLKQGFELYGHLGSTCLRGSTSTRIWTRALQPDQEEVSSWRFRRAQIVSGRQTFPPIFLLGTKVFARRGDFNARQDSIVRLYFYQAPLYCIPAKIFMRRQYFEHPPIISWDGKIIGIRRYFHETPRF